MATQVGLEPPTSGSGVRGVNHQAITPQCTSHNCNHGPFRLGNGGKIDFSLCKAWVYPQRCKDIHMIEAMPKALLKSLQVNAKFHGHFGHGIKSHYANTPMQYTAIFHGCKNVHFQMKFFNIFLIFAQNIDCGYTLEPPQ